MTSRTFCVPEIKVHKVEIHGAAYELASYYIHPPKKSINNHLIYMLGMYELDQFCVGNDLTEGLRELNKARSSQRCVVLQMFFLGLVHTHTDMFPFYLKA